MLTTDWFLLHASLQQTLLKGGTFSAKRTIWLFKNRYELIENDTKGRQ